MCPLWAAEYPHGRRAETEPPPKEPLSPSQSRDPCCGDLTALQQFVAGQTMSTRALTTGLYEPHGSGEKLSPENEQSSVSHVAQEVRGFSL